MSSFLMHAMSLQKDLVPVCRELGIGIVCYSPIGRGMLTGKYSKVEDMDPSDFRRNNPRFAGAAFDKVCPGPLSPYAEQPQRLYCTH